MTASFPTSIKTFTTKVDLVDSVLAAHVNQLQEEVVALETTLSTGLLVSTWSGAFSTPGSHTSLTSRLANIESGLSEHAASLSTISSGKADLNSPAFTGNPTAPTQIAGNSSTRLATTAFVTGGIATHAALTTSHGVSGSIVGTSDTQVLTGKTISGASNTLTNIAQASVTNLVSDLAAKAPLASPTLTGTPAAPTAAGGTSTTQISTTAFVAGEISTHAALTATHGATGAVVGTTNTQTLTNKTLTTPKLAGPIEVMSVVASGATGTVHVDVITSAVLYYTSNASANFTLNVRGNSSTTLNSLLASGDSVTVTFLSTNGGTAYYPTAVTVDGGAQTVKWQNGAAPSAGNTSSVDSYTLTIVKTGSGAFTAFGNYSKWA